MSVQKKVYMAVTRKPTNNKTFTFDEEECERVKEFMYLGTIVTEDNYITTETE